MLLLQGIARTAEQRRQLIKRMEPLAEENEKIKEAMKPMEKNIQRASASETLLSPMRGNWNTRRASYPSS